MKQIGIYKIENKINGKVYIGQSVDIKRRFRTHRYNAYNDENKDVYDLYLYTAIRKYGKENFTYTIIETCEEKLLNERERYWVSYYKSNQKDFGYNLSDGGDSRYVKELTHNSNITAKKQKIDEIKDLLLNSDLSIQEIAKQFNMTTTSISNINRGRTWACADSQYPLRDTRKKTFYYCEKCGKQVSTKYSKLCKKCDAERQHITRGHFIDIDTFKEDINNYGLRELSKKYNVSESTICKWSKKYNLPLKGWKQERRLKYEQIQPNNFN